MNRSASYRIVMAWLARQAANVDLTRDDSLITLGFQAGTSPSKSEVQSAWRALARKHHPDLGGDVDKMVELNAAKDILDGVRAPSRGYGRSAPAPKPAPKPARPEPNSKGTPKTVVTVAQALQGVNVPSDVRWKFMTGQVNAKPTAAVRGESQYVYGYVAYGNTEKNHVFLLLTHKDHNFNSSIISDMDVWFAKVYTAPLPLEANSVISQIKKSIPNVLSNGKLTDPSMPDVVAIPENWNFTAGIPPMGKRGRVTSLNDFLEKGSAQAPPKAQERSYYQPPKAEIISLEEALGGAGVPPNVNWLFRTEDVKHGMNYMGDESSMYIYGYVVCGVLNDKMVFLTLKHESYGAVVGGGPDRKLWFARVSIVATKDGVLSPKVVTDNVKKLLTDAGLVKPANPKIYRTPSGWTPSSKGDLGTAISLSEFFINQGVKKAPKPSTKPKAVKILLAKKDGRSKYYEGYGLIVGGTFYEMDARTSQALWSMLYPVIDKNQYANDDGFFTKEINRVKTKVSLARLYLKAQDQGLMNPGLPENIVNQLQEIIDSN